MSAAWARAVRVFNYFFAAFPDDELRDRILERARAIEMGWFIPTRPHQVHLTLRFLGRVPAQRDQDMAHALMKACARHQPYTMEIAGGGLWGDTIAWLGAVDAGQSEALASELDQELASRGFAARSRPFAPFITIARSQGGTEGLDVEALKGTPPVGTFHVNEVVLVQSRMTAFGPEYEFPCRARLV